MAGATDLADGIAYLREHCATVGRQQLPQIVLRSITKPGATWNPQGLLDQLGQYQQLGVTGVAAHIDGRTRAEWCENAERFGAQVLAKLD